jgi:quercetin dioxygenase-like cupin family protein
MWGQATELPFEFTAPHGQNLIDRRFVPEVETGARVIVDARNTGNGALSVFELVAGAGEGTTASARAELWVDLATLEATYLPPRAARTPKAGRYVIFAVPGGEEEATRRAGVLPAEPAKPKEKGRPKPVPAGTKQAQVLPRPGVGTVSLRLDPTKVKGAALSASVLDIDAGAAIPKHVHDGSTELIYLLAGAGTMMIDGVELTVTSTSVVQIPPGIEHSFTATEATRAIQVYAPPGPEQRFKQK